MTSHPRWLCWRTGKTSLILEPDTICVCWMSSAIVSLIVLNWINSLLNKSFSNQFLFYVGILILSCSEFLSGCRLKFLNRHHWQGRGLEKGIRKLFTFDFHLLHTCATGFSNASTWDKHEVSLAKNSVSFVLTLLTIKLEVPEEDGAEEALGLGTLSGSTEDVLCVLATVYWYCLWTVSQLSGLLPVAISTCHMLLQIQLEIKIW